MRIFNWSPDGGYGSGVCGFSIIELKSLFSIMVLHFKPGTREAFHSHAFNAVTLWLKGNVKEHILNGETKLWSAGQLKTTKRNDFHKVEALGDVWAISLRGPWIDRWQEFKEGKFITLTHGRKVVPV